MNIRASCFLLTLLCAAFCLTSREVRANPSTPTVVSGSATFSSTGQTLIVTASDLAIISWDSFSIDSHETTHFTLPSSTSVALNRVSSTLASSLAGRLTSNGIVYLIDSNGILITSLGQINCAGFLASTLDVPDADFLAGGDMNFSGSSMATLVNQGAVTAWDGDAILIAYQVGNNQTVTASKGIASLAAAQQVLLSPTGSMRITIETSTPPVHPQGVGLSQSGVVQAIQAELQADGGLYAVAINHEGWVNATGLSAGQGNIYLIANGGFVNSGGSLSAVNIDGNGGEIQVLGKIITISDGAEVYVSGKATAGTALIGGSLHGLDPSIPNALNVTVDAQALFSANSLNSGDGGTIVVWANNYTGFYGTINAQGGPFSGNGGTVEVSGVLNMDYEGTVDVSAPQGMAGTILMDPKMVVIGTKAELAAFSPLDLEVPVTKISFEQLQKALQQSQVTIEASQDIILLSPLPKKIDPSRLTLKAGRNLLLPNPQEN